MNGRTYAAFDPYPQTISCTQFRSISVSSGAAATTTAKMAIARGGGTRRERQPLTIQFGRRGILDGVGVLAVQVRFDQPRVRRTVALPERFAQLREGQMQTGIGLRLVRRSEKLMVLVPGKARHAKRGLRRLRIRHSGGSA